MARPDLTRVPEPFHRYINTVKEDDLFDAFRNQETVFAFLAGVPESKHEYRYAEGKWSLKEMLQHIIDAERVFSYRAMCFARREQASLPSFDEDAYAAASNADARSWADLLEEFRSVRIATELLFRSFNNEQLESAGMASNKPNYVLGMGFVAVGHVNHHVNVIREKYLS